MPDPVRPVSARRPEAAFPFFLILPDRHMKKGLLPKRGKASISYAKNGFQSDSDFRRVNTCRSILLIDVLELGCQRAGALVLLLALILHLADCGLTGKPALLTALLVIGEAGSCRDQASDNYVLLESAELVNLACDRSLGENSGGLLEGGSGDEGLGVERSWQESCPLPRAHGS